MKLTEISQIVIEHQRSFLEKWHEYFSQQS